MDVTVQLAAYTTERLLAAPWITRTPGIIIQGELLHKLAAAAAADLSPYPCARSKVVSLVV
jgi:hypothetical protein